MSNSRPAPQRFAIIAALVCSLILVAFALGMSLAVSFLSNDKKAAEVIVQDDTDVNDDEVVEVVDDVDSVEGEIVIDWFDVSAQSSREFNFYLRRWWEASFDPAEVPVSNYTARVLGTVEAGQEYETYDLVQATVDAGNDIGSSPTTFYILEPQKGLGAPIVLTRYTVREPSMGPMVYSEADIFHNGVTTEGLVLSSATVDGLTLDSTLHVDDSTIVAIGVGEVLADRAEIVSTFPVTMTTDEGVRLREYDRLVDDVSLNGPQREFFAVLPNGRISWYTIDLPFWDEAAERVQAPSIVWADGAKVSSFMRGVTTGCGFGKYSNVVTEKPTLKEGGYVAGAVTTKIFVPVDYSDALLADDHSNWSWVQKAQSDTPDVSIAAFAAAHPVFYYQDSLGRWLKFVNSDVVAPGECGKPVIYLYPEETTDIRVQLAPQGGFTKTEPAYGNGWNVTASPDGSLVNKADGKTYPYRFWEGRGGLYSAPERYWVVAKSDVPSFLNGTLAKFGFNQQEIADFSEFWVPRMQNAPYFKIGFYGTDVMNIIAPMTLSEKPDTLFRVLMDYSELSKAEPSNPPTLPATPVRKGFTVTEWGGVIR